MAKVTGFSPSYIDTRVHTFDAPKGFTYRPITGWFERTAGDVWDFVFSTGDTIGATSNHAFFSEDRQLYWPIGEFAIGERVKLKSGSTAALDEKLKRPGLTERVYNLEVWREHNYHVGMEGLLVHNNCINEIEDYVRRVSGINNWKIRPPSGGLTPGTKPGCSICVSYANHNGYTIYFDANGFPVFEEFAGRGNLNNHVIKYVSDDLQGYPAGFPTNTDANLASGWLEGNIGSFGSNIQIVGSQVKINNVLHTWHHHQDGRTLFLVPSDIHSIHHTGGGALIKYGLKGALPGPNF